MSQIIADTYEIIEKIGAGGGGTVYLGKHLRLQKYVVLKADKRTISAKQEVLRREVDALKDLNHTYIPQVYDYVQSDEVVYTVMDYIEGESMDKLLARGERFEQSRVVAWACQLLEALCYLHSRPPYGILHSDIKPANVMLTPQDDIRLIDFNIALALGEEGAVRVGYSQGYASPEHYGLDYSGISVTRGVETGTPRDLAETVLPSEGRPSSSQSGHGVLLDVRSDIYSLGATLYHLLTGRHPNQDARAVVPISVNDGVSAAVVSIIQKAMEPDPNLRYQTAAEMLYAFEHLHENDPRTKWYHRAVRLTVSALTCLFLIGGLCIFTGLQQQKKIEEQGRIVAENAERALATVTASEDAYRRGDIQAATAFAVEALSLDSPNVARAQKALTDALGIYDLSDNFRSYRTLELLSELLKLVLSPEGKQLAAVSAFQVNVFDTETGEKLAELPIEPSALSEVIFLNEDCLLYAGEGALTAYDLTNNHTLWTGNEATALSLSADGTSIASIYKDDGQAYVYDTESGALLNTVFFQDRHQRVVANDVFADAEDDLFVLDASGKYMAVSFSDGSLSVFELDNGDELELLAPSEYVHFEGGFFGPYFAFSAWDGQESIFAVVDVVNMIQTGGFSSQTPFRLQVDETGICIASDNLLVRIDPETGEQAELAYLDRDIVTFQNRDGYTITATADQSCVVFDSDARKLEEISCEYSCDFLQISDKYAVIGSRDSATLRLLKRESHLEAELLSYDSSYYHNEARLSADGSTVMLFSYLDFRLYNRVGELLASVSFPNAEQIYDQQYRREDDGGSYLEVIYNDGTRRTYSAKDGTPLEEWNGEKPDDSLQEEFLTDRLRIVSPLHGTPEVYDRESGELICNLEEDAYLTYVTQVGSQIITEYVSTQGDRYGLLLDENFQPLAQLPNLCDIIGETLVFDYPSGNLRQCHIYSRQELLELAQQ